MTKEKIVSLTKYLQSLNNRLTSSIPDKHKNHPETFMAFLKNEVEAVSKQLADAKLEGTGK